MDKQSLRIIYLGTPDFAVEPLKLLVENNYNVVGVVTNPDKPAGRGQKILESPVKKYAKSQGLNILQPEKFRDEDFLSKLKSLNADLQIIVAFKMLPEIVWSMPKYGTFNLHASLLPHYRGAAPINWAVINGDTKTGITTFFLKHEIDTGNIIFQEKIEISETDNAGSVHDKLMYSGASLVLKTVDAIINNNYKLTQQDTIIDKSEQLKNAPKIFKDDCKIDWSKDLDSIHNLVRGLSPYPAAWSTLENNQGSLVNTKIFETQKELVEHNHSVGTIFSDKKTYLKVAVNNGFLIINELQQAGKKRMKTSDFLRGFQKIDEYRFC
ncbi:MAG: methionyl-tRNA formyltransferase [Bacteroidales bacterium]|nr:methionyl-tRNA formyltransferase [Bacteroidales bacterium]